MSKEKKLSKMCKIFFAFIQTFSEDAILNFLDLEVCRQFYSYIRQVTSLYQQYEKNDIVLYFYQIKLPPLQLSLFFRK